MSNTKKKKKMNKKDSNGKLPEEESNQRLDENTEKEKIEEENARQEAERVELNRKKMQFVMDFLRCLMQHNVFFCTVSHN